MDAQRLPQIILAAPDPNSQYREALNWLLSFATYQRKTADAYQASKRNLERMRAILARLGDPHEGFAVIHIAGTKGKGSTAAVCDSILRAAGLHTGLYTSPHLHTFRERVCTDGEMISRQAVVEGIGRLRAIQPEFPDAIVFEWITALAFDYLARVGVDFAVVETGVGGRLDSTNVVRPRVSIITSISYDHTAILGDTLAQIAREKAGIIKPGIPVVISPQTDEARAALEETARERNAPVTLVGRDLEYRSVKQDLDRQEFRIVEPMRPRENFKLHLLGPHQLANAATAIAAMRTLAAEGVPISDVAIRAGVENARWPGRFEILERAPYVIVDGAHNRDSARQLVATIGALLPQSRVQWIFGASDDKDVRGMFAELLPRASALIVTRANHPRASEPSELAKLAQEFGAHVVVSENVAEALKLARSRADRFDVTVVAGSLFVVAEARAIVLRGRGRWVESDDV